MIVKIDGYNVNYQPTHYLYKEWDIASLESKRSEFNSLTSRLLELLPDLRSDYAKLEDQEVILAHLVRISQDTNDIQRFNLVNHIHGIDSISDEISKIPGYANLLNFSLVESFCSSLNSNCINFNNDIETLCNEIDDKRKSISKNIANINYCISQIGNELIEINYWINENFCGKNS